jgi:thioredoxin-dependent peroxiredoxin
MAPKSPKKSASKTDSKSKAPAPRKTPAKSRAKASAKTLKKSARPKASANKAAANKASVDTSAGAVATLHEGDRAPDFTLQRDGDSVVRLVDFAGRKLVVFFYPRADTPGCTLEAIDFTRHAKEFEKAGTGIVGISADDVRAQTKFRDKHSLGIPLGADGDFQTIKAYGAWGEKSMYGRTFLGIIRTTVLVDADGKVARIWRKVKVDGHAAEVLEAARAL